MKKIRLGFVVLTMAAALLMFLSPAQAVDFKISGQVNRAILYGDNGNSDDVKFVDNDNSSTRIRFVGSNDFDGGWNAGINIEVQMESNSSSDTQIDIGQNGDFGGTSFTERKLEFTIGHEKFGTIYMGQGDTASNSTSEIDLSGTDVVAYSSIADMAGGFNFRTDDDVIVASIGSVFSNFDGLSRRDRIRYDTPKFGPVYFSTSYMNGQSWDVAGRFAYEWTGLGKLAAAAHYTGAETQRDPYAQYSASASFLLDMGLNFTAAYGLRDFDNAPGRDDAWSAYGKIGYKMGKWAFSLDYTYSESVDTNDDEATSVGVATVFKPWDSVEIYGAYRWHELDRDAVSGIEDVNAVMLGGRVKLLEGNNLMRLFKSDMFGLLCVIVIAAGLLGCGAKGESFEYQDISEIPEGPGLLTGEEGRVLRL